MATRNQKYDAYMSLLSNPNTKLTAEYLANIKLNLDRSKPYEEMDSLNYFFEIYELNNKPFRIVITVRTSVCVYTKTQVSTLHKLGFNFVENKGSFSYTVKDKHLLDEIGLMRFIQSLNTEITVERVDSQVITNDFLKLVQFGTWPLNLSEYFNDNELDIISTTLNLDGLLSDIDSYDSERIDRFYETSKVRCLRQANGFLIYDEKNYHRLYTKRPITIIDVITDNTLEIDPMFRGLIIFAFMLGEIPCSFVFDEISPRKDPLTLFNKAIDELQAKDLPIEELAKQLILISSKHLV